MKHIKAYFIGMAVVSAVFSANAQQASRTAYFLDGYSYRHELNPALGGERNYFSIPVLANIGVGLQSNVGVNTFLYKSTVQGYDLTTFMSPSVSADEFLGKLGKYNHVNANLNLTLLSTGFKAFGGFNTISAGVRTEVGVVIPKELFEFMKLGQTGPDTRYSFENLQANASAMAEIELGHSRAINEKLNIGAKLKFLLGVGNVNAKINRMDVRLSNSQWSIDAEGELNAAAGSGLSIPTKQEIDAEYDTPAEADLIEWDNIKYNNFGLSGFGMAVDLGATYKLLPDLTLSAAVLDLGFMGWNNNIKGRTSAEPWTFEGFKDVAIMEDQDDYEEKKLSQQIDDMVDGVEDMINFHRIEEGGKHNQMLHATINLGAEYCMPFYRNLTAGFLFTQYIAGCSSWTEGRFSANVKPVKWFDATVSYGASTYGSSFGWMLNFHPKGINFFIGSDHQFFKVTPQFVPVGHATAAINLGFNVTFGS